jgi:kinetochore protein Mis12/MTW1
VKAEQQSSPTRLAQRVQDIHGAFAFLSNTESAQALGIISITANASTSNSTPLETNTSFTLAQLPALKALLHDLRPKLAGLGGDAGAKESEQARERRTYIENQTRKVLEKRGVEIDNELVELGRRVPPEELAALESIVESMGGINERDRIKE